VHHVRPVHLFPELELEPGNLVTLCEGETMNCHLFFGHLGWWKAWNPTVAVDASRMRRKMAARPTGRG